jgi:hypothetical protein
MKQVKTFFIQNILGNKIITSQRIKRFIFYLAAFLGIIFINYLYSKGNYGGQDFYVNWASVRLLFFQRIDPYSQEAIKYLADLAKELMILQSGANFQFTAPLYSLFIYLPFSLIKNFDLSRAIWMTAMELIAFASGYFILNIFNWHPEKLITKVFFAFSLLFFYVITSLLSGSNLILLNLIFILGLKYILDDKYLIAAIMFALLTINIQTFIIPIIAVLFYSFQKKAWIFPVWFFTSIILLGLTASLFITDWPLGFLREILHNPVIANFGLPGDIINQWLKFPLPWIWNYVALILLVLLFYELLIQVNEKNSFIWKISLAIVLNPLIWIQTDLNILVTFLFPIGLIYFQWTKRDKHIGSILIVLLSIAFSLGLFSVGLFTKSISFIKPYPFFLYIIPILILLINLYWIRWWMVRNNPTNNYL